MVSAAFFFVFWMCYIKEHDYLPPVAYEAGAAASRLEEFRANSVYRASSSCSKT